MQTSLLPSTYLQKPLSLASARHREAIDRKVESGLIFYGEDQFLKGYTKIRISARLFAKFIDPNPSAQKFVSIYESFKRMMQPTEEILIDEHGRLRLDKKYRLQAGVIKTLEYDWDQDFIDIDFQSEASETIRKSLIKDSGTNSVTLNFIAQQRLPNRGPSLSGYHLFSQFRPIPGSVEPVVSQKMEPAVLREHFNKHGKTWEQYKYLKNRALVPAINKINQDTDIFVEMFEQKQGRVVTFVWFEVSHNNNFSVHRPEKAQLAKVLNRYGMAPNRTNDLVDNPNIPTAVFETAIESLETALRNGTEVKNAGGWLIRSIEGGGWKSAGSKQLKKAKANVQAVKENQQRRQIEARIEQSKSQTEITQQIVETILSEKSEQQVEALKCAFKRTLDSDFAKGLVEQDKLLNPLVKAKWFDFVQR